MKNSLLARFLDPLYRLVHFQAQRPSYDDDFDSEVDDDDDGEEIVQVKQVVPLDSKNKSKIKRNKLKTGKDASDDDTEDSDFEDPDEIEVPGGGKDLDTLLKVTGKPALPITDPSPGWF